MATERPRRVAVSGLGSIACQHVAAFGALGNVEVIAFDPSEELRESALASGSIVRAHDNFEALLAEQPDALVIAAPDFAHLPQLEAAVALQLPTLVEKPLSDSLENARSVVSQWDAQAIPVLVGYVLRHRLAVGTVKRLIDAGAIGTPVSFQVMLGAYGTITAASSRFSTPEPDRLYRDYSHEWDYLRWIFGPVREVLAVARTTEQVPHIEHPNIVDGLIAMKRDVVGSFHIDYVEPRGTRTLHIVGTGGSIFADIGQGKVTLRIAGESGEHVIQQVEPNSEPLRRQAKHLLAVAAGNEVARVTLTDGLAALEVTDALIRSSVERSWVSV